MGVIHIDNPQYDLSPLLFSPRKEGKPQVLFSSSSAISSNVDKDCYVGPIHVTKNGVSHGLGMVASRDITAGECLFVIPPALSSNIDRVFQEWKSHIHGSTAAKDETHTSQTLLERISEEVLIRSMKETLQSENDSKKTTAQSFLLQLTSGNARKIDIPESSEALIQALVGKSLSLPSSPYEINEDSTLLGIIHRNAFGPDFTSYESVESRWKELLEASSSNAENPSRLLGLYPLAAMINHSCVPNAIRVFACRDWMIAHASANIKRGEEIVWSYLPPVLPFPQRRAQLQERHGFVCRCVRCRNEEDVAASSNIYALPKSLKPFENAGSLFSASTDQISQVQFTGDLLDWEESSFAGSYHSNETRRYWKMGNVNLYIHYLNSVLMDLSDHAPQEVEGIRKSLLKTAMDLHFCFVTCHMASTEHISVLHLCYELVSIMHSRAIDPSETLPKVKFWTEQLKRAHIIRYGALGSNIENIRAAMKHTQAVLRNRNGLEMAHYDFI